MIKAEISLKEIDAIQQFNRLCSHCDYDIDLVQGKYLIDAKSIMGIFSLDVKRPLTLVLNTEDSAELDKFKTYLV